MAFPADFWLKFPQGEVLAGMFKLTDGSDVAYICNHNAWAWQGVVMDVVQDKSKPKLIERFDRDKADWVPVGVEARVNFAIAPADAEVYRFRTATGDSKPTAAPPGSEVAKVSGPQQHFERLAKLLAERKELAGGNQPYAVYSTPTLRTQDNEPKAEGVPQGEVPFPADFWLTVKQGELTCGVMKLADGGDAVVFANPNREAWQGVVAVPKQDKDAPTVIWEFEDEAQKWIELGAWEDVNFAVPPGGATLLKFKR
jgi:hypothetical protein